jgi:hypothetical protein
LLAQFGRDVVIPGVFAGGQRFTDPEQVRQLKTGFPHCQHAATGQPQPAFEPFN